MELNFLNTIRKDIVENLPQKEKSVSKDKENSNTFQKLLDKGKTNTDEKKISNNEKVSGSNEVKSEKVEEKLEEKVEECIQNLDENSLEELKKQIVNLLAKVYPDEIQVENISNKQLKDLICKFINDNCDFSEILNKNSLDESLTKLLSQLNMDENINDSSIKELIEKSLKEAINSFKKEVNNAENKEMPKLVVDIKENSKDSLKDNTKENSNKNNNDSSKNLLKSELIKEDKLLEKISGEKQELPLNKFNNLLSKISNNPVEDIPKDNLLINKTSFNEDIIKSIKYMNLNNIQDLVVKVNPKHLGEIVINLTMEGDMMKAQLKAVNKETVALLNANVKEIMDKLTNDTIKIQNVEVSVYNEDTTYFNDGSYKENQSNENNKEKNNNINGTENIDESNLNSESEDKDSNDDMLNVLV
ncbi:flagellar hook-length control protein FliK [Clostridium senegalense]|uniref:flagellar hook-length control protein FliK n=1 Tax=Clostridium senegalense TaxID=1465809 RepID=UPI001C114269|nr:flagellar hook-length control protein FliK [Clostridium senegalense]MBU5225381.1 flagellar hook-length control protein FliK [Clostridium senegalense]